jgi:HAD superfamily hydrolase (TIGR01509 family)
VSDKISFTAVIFDLDGTLIDSEKNYVIADGKILTSFGIEYTPELRTKLLGRGIDTFVYTLINDFGVKKSYDELIAMKDEYYLDVARTNTRVFPEMQKLLEILRGKKIPMAVASGSSQQVVEEMLGICKIADYFPVAVSSLGLAEGKPAPDVFLEAAKRLGVPPKECFVLEDSPSGVQAAIAAGMKVAAIPTLTSPPLDPEIEKADILFRGGIDTFSAEELMQKLAL